MLKDSKKRNMVVRIMFVVYAIVMAYFLLSHCYGLFSLFQTQL